MTMADFLGFIQDNIYDYIDIIWLPVIVFVVHKHQRWLAFAFVLTCLLTFRAQVELMEMTGYDTGFLPFMQSHIQPRGLIVYSVIFCLYTALAYFSPRSQKIIFFAASLTIYIFSFCVSMLLMAL